MCLTRQLPEHRAVDENISGSDQECQKNTCTDVLHLASEVDIRIHFRQDRSSGASTDSHSSDHTFLVFATPPDGVRDRNLN